MAGMAVMLFLFLLKFIFKKNSGSGTDHVEIKERDHPKLFQFIRQLSDEVGAPFPKKIFVNHEINASVFYNSTVFSLTTLSLNASTDLTCASLKAPNLCDSLENSLRASDPPPNIFIISSFSL